MPWPAVKSGCPPATWLLLSSLRFLLFIRLGTKHPAWIAGCSKGLTAHCSFEGSLCSPSPMGYLCPELVSSGNSACCHCPQRGNTGKETLDILNNWQFATAASVPQGNSSALALYWLEGLTAPALATVLRIRVYR